MNLRTTLLLVVVCFILLFIPMISGMEWDNKKNYNPELREVTITNALGLGADIGKARLNTPLNVKVGAGYQKVAEFDIWAYQDYSDALKQFTFKDMKTGESINREIDIKYLTYENVLIDDYENVKIGELENGTIIYNYI